MPLNNHTKVFLTDDCPLSEVNRLNEEFKHIIDHTELKNDEKRNWN